MSTWIICKIQNNNKYSAIILHNMIKGVHGCRLLTQARYSVAFPFLRWGLFLPMGTEDFRKFLRASYFFKYFFPLSSNVIIKQWNIHIYSIYNLGYHTIIYKYYITLYISILVFGGYWPNKSLRSLCSHQSPRYLLYII